MRLALGLCMLALAGCMFDSDSASPPTIKKSRQQRVQDAQQLVTKTPAPRTYRYPDAELRVFEVPVADGMGFVELQRCFVWRDLEFKTSTISCGQQPDVPAPDPTP